MLISLGKCRLKLIEPSFTDGRTGILHELEVEVEIVE